MMGIVLLAGLLIWLTRAPGPTENAGSDRSFAASTVAPASTLAAVTANPVLEWAKVGEIDGEFVLLIEEAPSGYRAWSVPAGGRGLQTHVSTDGVTWTTGGVVIGSEYVAVDMSVGRAGGYYALVAGDSGADGQYTDLGVSRSSDGETWSVPSPIPGAGLATLPSMVVSDELIVVAAQPTFGNVDPAELAEAIPAEWRLATDRLAALSIRDRGDAVVLVHSSGLVLGSKSYAQLGLVPAGFTPEVDIWVSQLAQWGWIDIRAEPRLGLPGPVVDHEGAVLASAFGFTGIEIVEITKDGLDSAEFTAGGFSDGFGDLLASWDGRLVSVSSGYPAFRDLTGSDPIFSARVLPLSNSYTVTGVVAGEAGLVAMTTTAGLLNPGVVEPVEVAGTDGHRLILQPFGEYEILNAGGATVASGPPAVDTDLQLRVDPASAEIVLTEVDGTGDVARFSLEALETSFVEAAAVGERHSIFTPDGWSWVASDLGTGRAVTPLLVTEKTVVAVEQGFDQVERGLITPDPRGGPIPVWIGTIGGEK